MKYFFTIIYVLYFFFELNAQNPDRYRLPIFPNIQETTDIQFSTGIPNVQHQPNWWYDLLSGGALINVKEYNTLPINLYMDVFEPEGDVIEKRPLIILCFGGGFVQGSRKYWSIRLLAEELARLGYVTASIDYRIGMNLFDKEIGARAVYRAIQDSRSAVRYFKADAAESNQFRVDTNFIFIGGHSSGGFVALHNLFMDNEEEGERPCSTYDWVQDNIDIPDQQCLDCVGDNQSFNGKATGLINLAGALGFLNLIDGPQDAPPILFHSQDDGTVPFDTGEPFQDRNLGIIGADLPIVYGSLPISKRCDTVGLDYQFNAYTSRGHGVHEEIEMVKLYDDIVPSIAEWLYAQYLRPQDGLFAGDEDFCRDDLTHQYTFSAANITYYDWQVTGGSIIEGENSDNQITIAWDETASEHKLSVLPYTNNGTAGNFQEFTATIFEEGPNFWAGASGGDWKEKANWSRGHLPLPCETVIFNDALAPLTIVIPEGMALTCKGIQTGNNVELIIASDQVILTGQE